MAVAEPGEFVAGGRREHRDFFAFGGPGHFLDKVLCHDGDVAVNEDERVLEIGIGRDREVGGERPRGGRPDHETRALTGALAGLGLGRILIFIVVRRQAEGVVDLVRIGGFEIDVHGQVFAVHVFELGLGERGLVRDRPVHGLERAVDKTVLEQIGEHFEHAGFVLGLHRHVRVFVVGEREQAGHLLGVQLLILFGVLLALSSDGDAALVVGEGQQLVDLLRLDQFGHDLVLDGQAVAIPSGHVRRIAAVEPRGLDRDVLEHLVHQVAEMDRAVGVGRAVVEPVRWFARSGGAHFFVEPDLLPALECRGLVLHQIRLHGEAGLGEIERRAIAAFFSRFGLGALRWVGGIGVGGGGGVHGDFPARWGSRLGATVVRFTDSKAWAPRRAGSVMGGCIDP